MYGGNVGQELVMQYRPETQGPAMPITSHTPGVITLMKDIHNHFFFNQ